MKNLMSHSFGRKFSYAVAFLFTATLALTSCKKDDAPPVPVGDANVMFINSIVDGPAIEVYVNDQRKFSANPQANTGYEKVEAGSKNIKVNEAGTINAPFINVTQAFRKDAYYSIFAYGRRASVENLVIEDTLTNTTAGKAFIRLVHLAPNAPDVQVAVSSADSTVGQTFIPSTAYKNHSSFREVDAGSTILALRRTSDLANVYQTPAYNFEAGKFYTLIAQGLLSATGTDSLATRIIENQKVQ